MKPDLHHRLRNYCFDDPCPLIRLLRQKHAILVDLCNLNSLNPSDIYRITDVFVKHTHIDHFIGFNTIWNL
ncbi:MAG: ribonuclease Z, partial [Nitrospirota bacterium]|nr:ribonuclease Z [Nitrospirota bacterium]